MKNIKYKINDKINYKELKEFFIKLDKVKGEKFWARDVFHYSQRTIIKEHKAIQSSHYVTARINKKLIGMIRYITDDYFYFIIEVAVLPKYQGLKIGKQLMNLTIDYIKTQNFIKIFLFSIPGKEDYYAKFGFKNTRSQAMEIRPDEKNS